ncbi:MAG: hypothetical protein V3W18_10370 [candidate division Zixibacteria bacterium]
MKNVKTILITLLSVNFLSRFIILIRPLKYIDGLLIPDDAYLAMTIAKNISNGLGPLYGFDYTNGFQPLYVFLITPIYAFFPNDLVTPVHLSLFILAMFDTLALLFLFKLVKSSTRSIITPVIISLFWIFNPYVIENSLNGLETIISVFFIILSLYYFKTKIESEMEEKPLAAKGIVLGIILGLAILARIDNTILAFAVMIVFVGNGLKAHIPPRIIANSSVIIIVAAVLTVLPWLLYSYHYTGDIYQVSGNALRYMSLANVDHLPTLANWYLPMIKVAVYTIIFNNKVIILLLALSTGVIVMFCRKLPLKEILIENRVTAIMLIYSTLIFCAYSLYIFGDWFFPRYLFPLILPLLLILSQLLNYCDSLIVEKRVRYMLIISLATLAITANIYYPNLRLYYSNKDTTSRGYMNLGLWASERFEDGTRIASSQTGALAYFADNLDVINIDGVVNKSCFEALKKKRNIEYIRENRIEYVLGWDFNIKFIEKESANYKPDDLTLEEKIEGFTSWKYRWYLYRVNY